MEAEQQSLVPPPLFPLRGEWQSYQEELYKIYCETLRDATLSFRGLRVSLRRYPEIAGLPRSFTHLISDGPIEEERIPDIRRCERIAWIGWMIGVADSHPAVSSWENKSHGDESIILWHEEESYAVILGKRNGYYSLKTAYLVSARRAVTFRKERDAYLSSIRRR